MRENDMMETMIGAAIEVRLHLETRSRYVGVLRVAAPNRRAL